MKIKYVFLVAVATFAFYSVSNASIIGASWADDGDGAIICQSWGWNSSQSSLWMYGDQYGLSGQPGAPAHMVGTITTDTLADPTLTLGSAVENDTGLAWIGYQVNVIMSVPFTFTTPGPTVNNPSINDWFLASTVNPAYQVSGPHAGMYEGTYNFSGGTQVGIGDELDYLYSIHFTGATSYSFTQEITPMFAPVPEPGAVTLLAIGGLGFAIRLRRNSHKGA
jgi:hypothetical protein